MASLCTLFENSIGSIVQVTTANNNVYQGILYTCSIDVANPNIDPMGVCLKLAKNITTPTNNTIINTLLLKANDVLMISVLEFSNLNDTFKTDTAISSSTFSSNPNRKLEKWQPDNSVDTTFDDTFTNSGTWDQFATNEQKFGVTTDFDEDLYTTSIDKSGSDFKKREADAIRLAKEINSKTSDNPHLAEERGQVNAINETMNEEEKYSGVLRSGAPGKYQPPPARSSPSPTQKNKPPIIVSSPTKPAFSYSAAAASKLPPKKNPPKITTNAKHQSFQTPPPQTAYPTITKRESSTNKYPQSAKTEHPPSSAWTDENGSPATSSSVKSTATKPGRAPTKSQHPLPQPATTKTPTVPLPPLENMISHEKTNIIREKETLLIRKKLLSRKEKDTLIDEFKSFSANFKLKTSVPKGFDEILGKKKGNVEEKKKVDEEKKVEEKKKVDEEKKAEEKKEEEKKKEFKLNPGAVEFKMNFAANEFVPGSAPIPTSRKSPNVVREVPISPIPFFGIKRLNKTPLSITDTFTQGFIESKVNESIVSPSLTSPTWPHGTKPFPQPLPPQFMVPYGMVPMIQAPYYPMEFEDGYYGYPVPPYYRPMRPPQPFVAYPPYQQMYPPQPVQQWRGGGKRGGYYGNQFQQGYPPPQGYSE